MPPVKSLQLILVDPKAAMSAAWEKHFCGLPDVSFVTGRFEDLQEYDCLVSPANSFGLMDGGVDAAITAYFGQSLMQRVQRRILDDFLGEQSVGTSIIVETGHESHPFLAHTPTMRVPLEIAHTDHVYLAMWAMLLAVRQHNQTEKQPISIVACPGLGTGAGCVPLTEAARQMALAYDHFLNPPRHIDWEHAQKRQMRIRFGGDMNHLMAPEDKL